MIKIIKIFYLIFWWIPEHIHYCYYRQHYQDLSILNNKICDIFINISSLSGGLWSKLCYFWYPFYDNIDIKRCTHNMLSMSKYNHQQHQQFMYLRGRSYVYNCATLPKVFEVVHWYCPREGVTTTLFVVYQLVTKAVGGHILVHATRCIRVSQHHEYHTELLYQ